MDLLSTMGSTSLDTNAIVLQHKYIHSKHQGMSLGGKIRCSNSNVIFD